MFRAFVPLILLALLVAGLPASATAFPEKPKDPHGAPAVSALLKTNFSRQCDMSTHPLRKNLSYLFDNSYMGLTFKRWEVAPLGGGRYRVILHYVDGGTGPTKARWKVDVKGGKASLGDDNAEVLSCMTGYM